jgi:hypothetical protein
MKVRIAEGASRDEAAAIAAAVAEHVGQTVEVYVGESDEPTLVREVDSAAESDGPKGPDEGPTDRERRLREEIADIERGGPEKYRERLAEQGKLFVRDRLDLWFGGLDFEDGRFANFDSWHGSSPDVEEYDPDRRLPADGLITGAAIFEGRQLHVCAND